jgi:hypothetical protein
MFRKLAVAAFFALSSLFVSAAQSRADGFVSYKPFGGEVIFELKAGPGSAHPVIQKVEPNRLGQKQVSGAPSRYAINMSRPITQGWQLASSVISRSLPNVLSREYVKGVSAYDVRFSLAQDGQLEAWAYNDHMSFRYTVRGNKLAASLTTPSVQVGPLSIGAGKYADPRVELSFDIECVFSVTLNLSQAPVVTKASITILNAKLASKNLAGDILNGANSLVKFFGGPDFKSRLEGLINGQGVNASKPLTKVFQAGNATFLAMTKNAKTVMATDDGGKITVIYSNEPQKQIPIK